MNKTNLILGIKSAKGGKQELLMLKDFPELRLSVVKVSKMVLIKRHMKPNQHN